MSLSSRSGCWAFAFALIWMLQGGCAILTKDQCFDGLKSMDPLDFGIKTLACQAAGEINDDCCNEMMDLYGYYGLLDGCLCVPEFHSLLLDSMPTDRGVTPTGFLSNVKGCDIPARGMGCGGDDEAPVVNSQAIVGIAVRSIFRSGLAAGAALRGRQGYGYPYGYGQIGDDDDDDDNSRPRPVPVPAFSPPPKSPKPSQSPSPNSNSTQPLSPAAANPTPSQLPDPMPKSTGPPRQHSNSISVQEQGSVPTTGCQSVVSSEGAVDLSSGAQCVVLQQA